MNPFPINIQKTKAILIGVSDYERNQLGQGLHAIAPALNNVADMADMLMDEKILGLPKGNIVQVINMRNDQIYDAIDEFLDDKNNIDTETLILYYVGHGICEFKSGNFYLTGINTKPHTVTISGVPFNHIKERIEKSHVQRHVILLDSCYSGKAVLGPENEAFIDDQLSIKGSYTITSSRANEKTFFDSNSRNTSFTAALLNIIKTGLPNRQPFVSLDQVYDGLKHYLTNSNPEHKNNLNVIDFRMFRNVKYDLNSILLQQADQLFNDGEYADAETKYLQLYDQRPSDEIKAKIDKCSRQIAEAATLERKRKEQEALQKAHEGEIANRLKADESWGDASDINTEQSYQDFIDKYPNSSYASAAQQRLMVIRIGLQKKAEDEDWLKISGLASVAAFKDFLKKYPVTQRFNDINAIIHRIESEGRKQADEDLAWARAKNGDTRIAFQTFIESYPDTRYRLALKEAIEAIEKREKEEIQKKRNDEVKRRQLAEKEAWAGVADSTDPNAFRGFLAIYPDTIYLAKAKACIEDLKLWQATVRLNSYTGYVYYISNFPVGKYHAQAQTIIDRIANEQWQLVVEKGDEAAYRKFLTEYPKNKHTDDATVAANLARSKITEDKTWILSKEQDDITGYRNYLNKHPSGSYKNEAIQALAKLEEELWQKAYNVDNVQTYELFVNSFPESDKVNEAKTAIEGIKVRNKLWQAKQESTLWDIAVKHGAIRDYDNYLSFAPTGARAAEAHAAIAALQKKPWRRFLNMINTQKNSLSTQTVLMIAFFLGVGLFWFAMALIQFSNH